MIKPVDASEPHPEPRGKAGLLISARFSKKKPVFVVAKSVFFEKKCSFFVHLIIFLCTDGFM